MKNKTNKNKTSIILFGKHACHAALKNTKRKCIKIYATEKSVKSLNLLHNHPTPKIINIKEFDKMLPEASSHQGIAIEVAEQNNVNLKSLYDEKILVILDQITDPHNVGAILRSCSAFGAGGIITPKDNAPKESGAMAKAASGALESIPICKVTNLSRTIDDLKKQNFWIIGLDGKAKQNLKESKLSGKIAIVMGAEGKGIRPLTQKNCDLLVKLPISNQMESLNVSNATAICLYEINSQNF